MYKNLLTIITNFSNTFHLTMEYSKELLWNVMSHIDTTMSYDELECLVNFVAFEEMGIDIIPQYTL